ncbi:MAG: S9 family peptidase, partial [Acidimicrobiia bacterium]
MSSPSGTTPAISPAMVAAARGLAEPRLSPDGRRLAWVEMVRGGSDLVVVALDGGPAMVVTADVPVTRSGAYGGGIFTWVGNDHLAYAGADGQLVATPASGGPARILCREGRCFAPAGSPDGGRVAFVVERGDSADIAVVPLDGSQWPVRVTDGADFALDPSWSPDGATLAWHEWDLPDMPWDSSRIALRSLDGLALASPVRIVGGGSGVSVGQPRFSPDGGRLAYVSDQGGWANVWVSAAPDGSGARPVVQEEAEAAEPTWGAGQRSFVWSPESGRIAWCRNAGGFGSLVTAPVDSSGSGVEILGAGWHRGLDWRGEVLTAVRSGPRTAPGIIVGTPGGDWRVVARGPVAGFESAGLVEPEAVSWAGADGGEVSGLLYRPSSSDPGRELPPLIVGIHGGPTAAEVADWAPRRQFWLARGWA